jgi:diguanylate cyclase (GGDEF)-like protein
MATALHGTLRPYDLCVRYAGDEFIIVLAECSREGAEQKRRELQTAVSTIDFEVRPGKVLKLEASAGAAVFPHDGTSYEALLASADQAMYRDKAARRGHITMPRTPGPEFITSDVFDAARDRRAARSLPITAA